MFVLIPLAIFLISVVLAIAVIARKFVYLKKLTPETINESALGEENFWAELLPELSAKLRKIDLKGYKINFLAEFEKFLRKLRIFSMRLDTLTNRLIHHVRKSTVNNMENINSAAVEEDVEPTNIAKEKVLKEAEQRLIIEIAKTPKNAKLYKELGNVYLKIGGNQDAMEAFQKASELDPEDTESKAKLDKVLAKLNKMQGKNLPT